MTGPYGDPEQIRAGVAVARDGGEQARVGGELLRREVADVGEIWRGAAAAAFRARAGETVGTTTSLVERADDLADVLATLAAGLDDATATWRRARSLASAHCLAWDGRGTPAVPGDADPGRAAVAREIGWLAARAEELASAAYRTAATALRRLADAGEWALTAAADPRWSLPLDGAVGAVTTYREAAVRRAAPPGSASVSGTLRARASAVTGASTAPTPRPLGWVPGARRVVGRLPVLSVATTTAGTVADVRAGHPVTTAVTANTGALVLGTVAGAAVALALSGPVLATVAAVAASIGVGLATKYALDWLLRTTGIGAAVDAAVSTAARAVGRGLSAAGRGVAGAARAVGRAVARGPVAAGRRIRSSVRSVRRTLAGLLS